MASFHMFSVERSGVDCVPVQITATATPERPSVTEFHGWPGYRSQWPTERLRAAFHKSGLEWPDTTFTVTMAPHASGESEVHDLAAAIAMLTAANAIPPLGETVAIGQLEYSGAVRTTSGILACLLAARTAGHRRIIVPEAVLAEAELVDGLDIVGAATLADVVRYARGDHSAVTGAYRRPGTRGDRIPAQAPASTPELSCPQWAWRALAAAAAGEHHSLVTGPDTNDHPAFAAALALLLPPLDNDHAVELAAIRSLCGRLWPGPLDMTPPHETLTPSMLLACTLGGAGRPGSVSLAHHGLLHLAEAQRWSPQWWESLRSMLDNRRIKLDILWKSTEFPAGFQLMLSYRDTVQRRRWAPPFTVAGIPSFVIDRIPVRLWLTADGPESTAPHEGWESCGQDMKIRVAAARARAATRWSTAGPAVTNDKVPIAALRQFRKMPRGTMTYLEELTRRGTLTLRGVDQVLRLMWSLSDLADRDRPAELHLEEALALRLRGNLTVG